MIKDKGEPRYVSPWTIKRHGVETDHRRYITLLMTWNQHEAFENDDVESIKLGRFMPARWILALKTKTGDALKAPAWMLACAYFYQWALCLIVSTVSGIWLAHMTGANPVYVATYIMSILNLAPIALTGFNIFVWIRQTA